MLDNTVFLFTTDHGEMMGDHLRVQKGSYYWQSVRVPTAIRHPDHLDGRVVGAPIELTDLTATILDVAGLDPQQSLSRAWPAFHDRVPCRSLMPIVRGETDRVREAAFSECNGQWQMMRNEEWKYVRLLSSGTPQDPDERLFYLAEDPDELIDRAADPSGAPDCAAALSELRGRMRQLIDTTPAAQTRWAPLPLEPELYD
jgi:arylsulfatase A-like enzyme